MLITDNAKLIDFQTKFRVWQGIPAIEVTKGGRIFCAYYSGNTGEKLGNFVVLTISNDCGKSFSEPIAVAYNGEKARCFDQSLWIDPLDRLWFNWTCREFDSNLNKYMDKCYSVICENPDGENLVWGEERYLGDGVLLNKPTVLSTGEWLFPLAYWRIGAMAIHNPYGATAIAFRSVDNGKTFEVIGGAKAPNSSFDEHMFYERKDGVLNCYIRTFSGIAEAYSFDQGKHWTESKVSEIKGPGARFFIRRLKSGRVLLINHYDFNDRNNLTALLSDDDGKTWKWKLLLDERKDVSYPDAKQDEEGYIHIIYDRERGDERHSFNECYKDAREILYARITEEDIMAGKIVSKKGLLKNIASKLGKYQGKANLFNEPDLYSDAELSRYIIDNFKGNEVEKIFEYYPVKCTKMGDEDWRELDRLIEEFNNSNEKDKVVSLMNVVKLIRSSASVEEKKVPIIELVKEYVDRNWQENFSLQQLSLEINASAFYTMHQFKKHTGITILEYRTAIRMRKAKEMLLNGEESISAIASSCGFDDYSYFSKLFRKEEGCTPSEFRERFSSKNS